jgi:predicted DNA-binding transcriptional regulator AlpA
MPIERKLAFSINEFCQAASISRSKFYQLARNGTGPRTFHVGSKTLISAKAAEDWMAAREAAEADAS